MTAAQLSLFEEPAASPRHVPAPSAPPASAAPPPFVHPRARREVRLDGHVVAYELRRGRG